jgi:hypothetical protein
MTFTHIFSRRIRCTATAPDQPPPQGSVNMLDFEWSGDPIKPKYAREYVRWICEVNRQCADQWQTEILYVVQITRTQSEIWEFRPREAPRRVDGMEVEP